MFAATFSITIVLKETLSSAKPRIQLMFSFNPILN